MNDDVEFDPGAYGDPDTGERCRRRHRSPHGGYGRGTHPRRDGRGHGHGRGRGRRPGPGTAEGLFGPGGPFGPGGAFGPGGPFEAGFPGAGGPPFGPGAGHRRPRRRRRGDVRNGILLLLAEGPMNGYKLINGLAERSGNTWRPSSGAIYPALSQLEDEGLIEPAGDAGHKHYRLTDEGRAEAERLADQPAPWDDATEDAESRLGGTAELWKAFGDAALAVRAVVQTGDEAAAATATEELVALRKRLYGILAGPED